MRGLERGPDGSWHVGPLPFETEILAIEAGLAAFDPHDVASAIGLRRAACAHLARLPGVRADVELAPVYLADARRDDEGWHADVVSEASGRRLGQRIERAEIVDALERLADDAPEPVDQLHGIVTDAWGEPVAFGFVDGAAAVLAEERSAGGTCPLVARIASLLDGADPIAAEPHEGGRPHPLSDDAKEPGPLALRERAVARLAQAVTSLAERETRSGRPHDAERETIRDAIATLPDDHAHWSPPRGSGRRE